MIHLVADQLAQLLKRNCWRLGTSGRKSLNEVRTILADMGLSLGMRLANNPTAGLVFHCRCHRDACDAVEGSVGEDGRE
jgi:hypothetical protein